MSLLGAFRIGGLGMTAQTNVIGNVSDNLANSQTIGFKRIDSHFDNLVTDSSNLQGGGGGVRATPVYMNNIQGTLIQSQTTTDVAISGDGLFAVRSGTIGDDGVLSLNAQSYYTRRGDFDLSRAVNFDAGGNITENSDDIASSRGGYMVNGAGYFLMGYPIDTSGNVGTTLGPIEIASLKTVPVATTTVGYTANLPAAAVAGSTFQGTAITVYDSNGDKHDLNMTWTKMAGVNQWSLNVSVPDADTPISRDMIYEFNGPPAGTMSDLNATASFNASNATNIAADNGTSTLTLGSSSWAEQGYSVGDTVTLSGTGVNDTAYTITAMTGGVATVSPPPTTMLANTGFTGTRPAPGMRVSNAAGQTGSLLGVITPTAPDTQAAMSLSLTFPGALPQTMAISMGDYGKTNGMTQFAASTLQVSSTEQNGLPAGSFKSLDFDKDGFVTLNYDNGQSRRVYQIPLANFHAPNNLQRESGGVFTATTESGIPTMVTAGSDGTGTIVGNSLEASNVDIGNEFSAMIQSQRAYSANAQTVKITSSMLEDLQGLGR